MKLIDLVDDLSINLQYYVEDEITDALHVDTLEGIMYLVADASWYQILDNIQRGIINETS